MKKAIVFALLLACGVPLAAYPVLAAEGTEPAAVTDAGNKLCPISGEPVSGASFVEYQGKRYGLCCPGCDKQFLADPEKYLAKMKEKEQAASPAAPAAEEGHEHHEGMMM